VIRAALSLLLVSYPCNPLFSVHVSELEELSGAKLKDPVGVLENSRIVRDDDCGTTLVVHNAADKRHGGLAGGCIKRRGRLVGKYQVWAIDDGPRQCNPLALADAHLSRVLLEKVGEPNLGETLGSLSLCLAFAYSREEEWNRNVFQSGKPADKVESLEQEADSIPPETGQLGRSEPADLVIQNADLSLVGPQRASKN
jgi:hypothetical protein